MAKTEIKLTANLTTYILVNSIFQDFSSQSNFIASISNRASALNPSILIIFNEFYSKILCKKQVKKTQLYDMMKLYLNKISMSIIIYFSTFPRFRCKFMKSENY